MRKTALWIGMAVVAFGLLAGQGHAEEGAGNKGRRKQGQHKHSREDALKRFDKDGDGKLSDEEKLAAREGFKEKHPQAAERFAEMKQRFDKNGDGKLSEEEREAAKAWMKEHHQERGGAKGEMRGKVLERFDADGDGKLSDAEKAAAREAMKQHRGNKEAE